MAKNTLLLTASVVAVCAIAAAAFWQFNEDDNTEPRKTQAGPFVAGKPIGQVDHTGNFAPLTKNVKVFGGIKNPESCTFDPERNKILVMNRGYNHSDKVSDGFVSLVNPDGSTDTFDWIGTGTDLFNPLGSAIKNGVLYTVDIGFLRSFDLKTGAPIKSVAIPNGKKLNGIAVSDDNVVYLSNTTKTGLIFKVNPQGQVEKFVEGTPLAMPNGLAIDPAGNLVAVNLDNSTVITFDRSGNVVKTEQAVSDGSDGIVIAKSGDKYISSVRHGTISKIDRQSVTTLVAKGIPLAASMCFDSNQNRLVVPLKSFASLAFVTL